MTHCVVLFLTDLENQPQREHLTVSLAVLLRLEASSQSKDKTNISNKICIVCQSPVTPNLKFNALLTILSRQIPREVVKLNQRYDYGGLADSKQLDLGMGDYRMLCYLVACVGAWPLVRAVGCSGGAPTWLLASASSSSNLFSCARNFFSLSQHSFN